MTPANDFAALVEALVTAQDDYSSLWYDAASERYAEMRQVRDDARAALLAYGAAMERERDQYREMYMQWIDWAREAEARCAPAQQAEDSYGMQTIIMERITTRPTEARDS